MTPDDRELMRRVAFLHGLVVGTLGTGIVAAAILAVVLG